jgi:hypothetical protein
MAKHTQSDACIFRAEAEYPSGSPQPHELMKMILIVVVSLIAIAGTLSFTGCNRAGAADFSKSGNGRECVIQFRRDALGAAANLPISPTANAINGAQTSVSGTMKGFREDWVVIDREGREIWVAKASILLIQY